MTRRCNGSGILRWSDFGTLGELTQSSPSLDILEGGLEDNGRGGSVGKDRRGGEGGGGVYSDTQLYGFNEERLRVAMVRLDRHHISQKKKSPLRRNLIQHSILRHRFSRPFFFVRWRCCCWTVWSGMIELSVN